MKQNFLLILITIISLHSTNCLYFLLTEGKEKCIYDEIPESEDVQLQYQLMDIYQAAAHTAMAELKIYDSQQKVMKDIQIRDGRKQKFAFISPEMGTYKFCFKLPAERRDKAKQVRFFIRLTIGETEEISDGAKQGDFVNLKEKAKKLDNKCQNYIKVQEMNRKEEDKLYQENEKIDERVISATIFQTIIILGSGIFQIISLRKFFIKIHVC